jgi:small-conductance mechanosensitive channel
MTNYPGAGQISTGFHHAMTRLKAALLVACLLFGFPTLALAQSTSAAVESGTGINIASVKAQVEGLKLELNQIEAGLERRSLSTELLGVQRQRLDDIGIQLRKFGDELNPRAESLRSRIKELGPEPDSKSTPESPEIAKDRADRDRALKEVDELIKITRSAALQASQLVDLVVEKRRDAFQAHLFERTSSLLAPGLWVDVVLGLPKDISAFVILSTNTIGRIIDVRGLLGLGFLLIGLASLVAIMWLTLDVTHKIAAARFPDANPSPFRKSLRTIFYALMGFALPTLAGFVMIEAFSSLGMVPQRLETILVPFVRGLAFIGFARGLVVGLTAVKHPIWSLLNLSPQLVKDLRSLVLVTMSLLVAGQVVEAVIQTIAAGLPLTVATRGSFAVLIAVVMMRGLQKLAAGHVAVEEDWCNRAFLSPTWLAMVRLVVWLSLILTVLAAFFGYVALSAFVVEQLIRSLEVLVLYILASRVMDEGIAALLQPGSRTLIWMETTVGLPQRSLNQLGVLASGLLQLLALGMALMIVLVPWGIQSADVWSSLRAVVFGLTIGDVTLSIATVVVALASFVIAIVMTRAIQRWMKQRYLPQTQLDSGIKNSLTTGVGYIGFIGAAALSLSSLGLSLDRLAIVAGALSVGIGFGLQSIVNNFVSGLILLWERSVRVGDLVIVGDEQGHVRRINIRATEIETFDRSTVIVPNSNLVSGVVKNRVHSGRMGRVLIALPMPRDIDIDAFSSLLFELTSKHGDILPDPKPAVLLKLITETTLNFELVAFVAEVDTVAKVSSELSISIWREVRALGMLTPRKTILTIESSSSVAQAVLSSPEPVSSLSDKKA